MYPRPPLHPNFRPIFRIEQTQQHAADVSRLAFNYPAASTDFFGIPSHPLCIFKTGSPWPMPGRARELRPIVHPLREHWFNILPNIRAALEARQVAITGVNAVAVSLSGEKQPFCPFLILVGVRRGSLSFAQANRAAQAVEAVIAPFGYRDVQIAFREGELVRRLAHSL